MSFTFKPTEKQTQYPTQTASEPRQIAFANVIEAIYYLKENPLTTFLHPLTVTRTMKRMMTEDEKIFLKSFKHLKYQTKK